MADAETIFELGKVHERLTAMARDAHAKADDADDKNGYERGMANGCILASNMIHAMLGEAH